MYNKGISNNQSHISMKVSKTNLYIKGLPHHFDDNLLEQLVPYNNKVKSVKAAMDEERKCKGYGFIDFISEKAAEEAKQHIETNHSTYPVKFAKENEKDRTNLYVTNIPKQWSSGDSDKLKKLFEKHGEVQSAFIMQEKSANKTTGVGFVRFSNEQGAEIAIRWLETHKVTLPECTLPLEAKYADKHNPETRKRRNIDIKSYPYSLMSHRSPVFPEMDIYGLSNRMVVNSLKPQDLFPIYPSLLSTGTNPSNTYLNTVPLGLMNSFTPMSNNACLWNINSLPYLSSDILGTHIPHASTTDTSCSLNPFIIPTNNFSSFFNSISPYEFSGNKVNQNNVCYNQHITE